MHTSPELIERAQEVLKLEAEAILALIPRMDHNFTTACDILLSCQGKVIVTGMGKSGHIARKIAATLASTGTPAFFVHPGEASHGDLGMIGAQDVVIALSNSGETTELLLLLPHLMHLKIPLISLTQPSSHLGQSSAANLDVSVAQEACPLDLAPTSSTTAALAMGDALALALLKARGFTQAEFARSHPSGQLGRRLCLRARDLMHQGESIPKVGPETPIVQALKEISHKRLGMTTVVAEGAMQVAGIFTDGDLRRAIDHRIDLHTTPIDALMTRDFQIINPDSLAIDALTLFENYQITTLPVIDDQQNLLGILHIHDLFKAGLG